MFGKNGNPEDARNRSVTILSPNVSVTGDIAFSGYLRVQGSVSGDVSCTSGNRGITVVHGPGSVTGSIKSPNIVVAGRVEGTLEADELIEVHKGAAIVGDARYKRLVVEKGGIIEGRLATAPAQATERPRQERRIAVSASLADKKIDVALPNNRRASDKFKVGHRYRMAAALAVAVFGAVLWLRQPAKEALPDNEAPLPPPAVADDAPAPAAGLSPAELPAQPPVQEAPPSPTSPVAAVPAPAPAPKPEVQAPPAPPPRVANPDNVIALQGVNPAKPANAFFVNTNEPCVLFKKKRDSAGEGTRIALPKGAKRRFSIAENEIVRVAEGTDLDMFYQGRKLPPDIVVSGDWMAFEPVAAPQ